MTFCSDMCEQEEPPVVQAKLAKDNVLTCTFNVILTDISSLTTNHSVEILDSKSKISSK